MNPKFKAGDRVVVVDADEGTDIKNGGEDGADEGTDIKNGGEYIVAASCGSHHPGNGGIINLEGVRGGFFGFRFELAKPKPRFNVGQKVRILKTHLPKEAPVGSIGEIQEIVLQRTGQVGYKVDTERDDFYCFYFYEPDLEAYVEPKQAVEQGNFTLAEEFEIPVIDPLTITYKGISITLDVNVQSSKMFAEVLLNTVYGKG